MEKMEKNLNKISIELFGDIDSIDMDTAKSIYRKLIKEFHPDNGGTPEKVREIRDAYTYVKKHILHIQKLKLAYKKCKLDVCINEVSKEHEEVHEEFLHYLKKYSLADDVANELKDKLDKKLTFLFFGHKNGKKKALNFMLLYLTHLVVVMFAIFYLGIPTANVPIVCTISTCVFMLIFIKSMYSMSSLKRDVKDTRKYKNKLTYKIDDLNQYLLHLELEQSKYEAELQTVNESLRVLV